MSTVESSSSVNDAQRKIDAQRYAQRHAEQNALEAKALQVREQQRQDQLEIDNKRSQELAKNAAEGKGGSVDIQA